MAISGVVVVPLLQALSRHSCAPLRKALRDEQKGWTHKTTQELHRYSFSFRKSSPNSGRNREAASIRLTKPALLAARSPGLRECFRRIKKTLMPQSGVRQRTGLPLLQSRKRGCDHASVGGGMIAATLPTLQQWKAGTLSDAALWHQCFFDPPETFTESGAAGGQ